MEIIDYQYLKPFNKKEKQEAILLCCQNKDNCNAFKRNQCTMVTPVFHDKCPYGERRRLVGYTKMAQKFGSWQRETEEKYSSYKRNLGQARKLCEIGDYIYFPYPHWSLDPSLPLEDKERSNIFSDGIKFIEKERFTLELFEKIVNANPRAFLGGPIKSYKEEIVPRILQHLKEEMPEFYKQWQEKYGEGNGNLLPSNVGRKAYINTLKRNVPFKVGVRYVAYLDDGGTVVIENYAPICLAGHVVSSVLRVVVDDNATVEVTDENQVSENTKFED